MRERGESGRRGDAREFAGEGDDGGIENARRKGKFVGEVEREGNLEGSWRSVRRKRRRMANQGGDPRRWEGEVELEEEDGGDGGGTTEKMQQGAARTVDGGGGDGGTAIRRRGWRRWPEAAAAAGGRRRRNDRGEEPWPGQGVTAARRRAAVAAVGLLPRPSLSSHLRGRALLSFFK